MVDVSKVLNANSAYGAANNRSVTPGGPEATTVAKTGKGPDFSRIVEDVIDTTVSSTKASEIAALQAANGKVSVEELAIAVNNAEVALRTVVAIRDRVVNAYNDIIKMPI